VALPPHASSGASPSGPAATSNWCASCGTVLANEQVIASQVLAVRQPVVRREFDQWFLKITDYAQELLDGLDASFGFGPTA